MRPSYFICLVILTRGNLSSRIQAVQLFLVIISKGLKEHFGLLLNPIRSLTGSPHIRPELVVLS